MYSAVNFPVLKHYISKTSYVDFCKGHIWSLNSLNKASLIAVHGADRWADLAYGYPGRWTGLCSFDILRSDVFTSFNHTTGNKGGPCRLSRYNRIWHFCICDLHLYKNALLLPKDKLSPLKNNLPYLLLDIEHVDPAAETGGTREVWRGKNISH